MAENWHDANARGSGVFVAACPKAAGMGDVSVHQACYRICVASFERGKELVVLVSGGDKPARAREIVQAG